MGPVVGTIGSLQALETIKVLSEIGTSLSGRMLIFDGLDFQTRIIKLRSKQIDCEMCKQLSNQIALTSHQIKEKLDQFDYNFFCGVSNYNDKSLNISILNEEIQRVTCMQYKEQLLANVNNDQLLIDVRPECQFKICSLPSSLSIKASLF